MKRQTVFEGIVDMTENEIDGDAVMIFPIVQVEVYRGFEGIDNLIEQYMYDISQGETPEEDPAHYTLDEIVHEFRNAKTGNPKKGIAYWRIVKEWDPKDLSQVTETFRHVGELVS